MTSAHDATILREAIRFLSDLHTSGQFHSTVATQQEMADAIRRILESSSTPKG